MKNREKILKAIQFIESNLKSDITVSDIAQEAHCSLYHFIRLFNSLIGLSPKKYLIRRRLTESIPELINADKKIASIAFDFQFGSHEVYTRAFQKYFGSLPSQVIKGKIIPSHLLLNPTSEDYIFQSKEARNQSPEPITLKEKIIIGLSFFKSGDLQKLDLTAEWKSLMQIVELVENQTNPNQYYQIQYWSDNQTMEGMHFFLGIEVNSIENIKAQFVVKIIPGGTYLKFIHKGLSRNVGYTYRYIYEEFLPDTDYDLSMPFNFEHYGKNYISPENELSESSLFIPITS